MSQPDMSPCTICNLTQTVPLIILLRDGVKVKGGGVAFEGDYPWQAKTVINYETLTEQLFSCFELKALFKFANFSRSSSVPPFSSWPRPYHHHRIPFQLWKHPPNASADLCAHLNGARKRLRDFQRGLQTQGDNSIEKISASKTTCFGWTFSTIPKWFKKGKFKHFSESKMESQVVFQAKIYGSKFLTRLTVSGISRSEDWIARCGLQIKSNTTTVYMKSMKSTL